MSKGHSIALVQRHKKKTKEERKAHARMMALARHSKMTVEQKRSLAVKMNEAKKRKKIAEGKLKANR